MRAHASFRVLVPWVLGLGLPPTAAAQVRPGIEVLVTDSAHLVGGKRVALLTNQTGVDRSGRRDVNVLLADSGLRLVVLFSPEHGFRGTENRSGVPNAVDSATGLPIYSLYGAARTSAFAQWDSIDVVLIDLQDVGARYYTYVSSATQLMQEAARRRKPVIALDRPDPVDGRTVQGNVRAVASDPDRDFVGFLPVPMRPGMTLGELLRLANDALGIHASLTVVPAAGWHRDMYFDATGLPWVPPSPAMPSLESAIEYPGICLFEGTNVSVGRGTAMPFQVVGAPWLDTTALLRRLRGAGMRDAFTGVELTADTITPRAPPDGKYDGVRLNVIRLRVTDRARYDPTLAAVALLVALRGVHRDSLAIVPERFDRLAAGGTLRRELLRGTAPAVIWRSWQPALARFRRVRVKYLLY